MNSELAKCLPIEVNPHSFDSSHTKCHLLLQAHFERAVLPCPDYVTDTKTVLDQSIRICQVQLIFFLLNDLVWYLWLPESRFENVPELLILIIAS